MGANAHLTDVVKTVRVSNAVAAGTTDVVCTAVNTEGYDGCRFVALFGTLTATQVTSMRVQQSGDDGSADAYTDLENSATNALGDDDDNDMLIVDILRPQEKWLKLTIDRATANAVVDGVIAELYRVRTAPVTQDGTVIDAVKLVTPAEGTA